MNAMPAGLALRLAALALQLRTGRAVEACVDLPPLMTEMAERMAALPAVAQQRLARAFAQVLQDWERSDWLGLADTLEYDLAWAWTRPE